MKRATIIFLVSGSLLAGCASRRKMSPDYGHAYHETIRAQTVQPPPASKASRVKATGLDPDEAQIVYGEYRRSLAPKSQQQQAERRSNVILMEDSREKRPVAP
jgi:hypothetical protein